MYGGQDMATTECPWVGNWVKKMWYICSMEYYSVIKNDEILPFATTWMDLENITLSKISQTEEVKSHILSLIYVI